MIAATHPVTPEEVMAFLDGELPTEKGPIVSDHIERCEECSAVASQLRGVSQNLSSWKVEAVAFELKDFRDGSKRGPSALDFLSSVPAHWRLLAMAGFLLLIISSLPVTRRSHQTSSPRQFAVNGRQFKQLAPLSPPRAAPDSNGSLQAPGDRIEKSLSVDGQLRAEQKSEALNSAIAGPMIARTVSLSLVVKDFAAARANLDAILRRHHGYAADLAANTAENAPRSLEASLRVPAAELDAALADLKAIGKVEREAQSGEEVTQQHADLVARLKNSRETEQRLQEILLQRTGKIKDVLEVEQEIARVRGEIEQMEAEQKSLEHRVEFATVNLTLNEEYKEKLVSPAISAGTRLHNALVEGYREASETVLGIILFFAEYTLTLLIWGLILVLPAILLWRRYRRALAIA